LPASRSQSGKFLVPQQATCDEVAAAPELLDILLFQLHEMP
jgi:hypothetical protein